MSPKDFVKSGGGSSPPRRGRQALGRGLENLFPPPVEESPAPRPSPPPPLRPAKRAHPSEQRPASFSPASRPAPPPASSLRTGAYLGIEQIYPNPRQPRRIFEKEFLAGLARSIKENGLIQPVIVKKAGTGYEIVAGERRWRAAIEAGLHKIPVRILEKDSPFLPLVENLQRRDLNPVELARAYKTLLQREKLTQEELAHRLGLARATLANQLRVLSLPEEVQKLILEGKLSFAVAKIVLKEKDPALQIQWGRRFAQKKAGVRQAERMFSNRSSKARPVKALKPWQTQALNKIRDLQGVKATLRLQKTGGELCLRFFSEEELSQLMDLLLSSRSPRPACKAPARPARAPRPSRKAPAG